MCFCGGLELENLASRGVSIGAYVPAHCHTSKPSLCMWSCEDLRVLRVKGNGNSHSQAVAEHKQPRNWPMAQDYVRVGDDTAFGVNGCKSCD